MSELVTAINRLSAAIETYNETNSVMQLVDRVPGMDKIVGRFVEAKLTEQHPEILSHGLTGYDPSGKIGIADGYELVKKQEPSPLTAGQLNEVTIGLNYLVLSTSPFYQDLVGKTLKHEGKLNAFWARFSDHSQLSDTGKPMVYYLPVSSAVKLVEIQAAPAETDDVQIGQTIRCEQLTEKSLKYTYVVVQGEDTYDQDFVATRELMTNGRIDDEDDDVFYVDFDNATLHKLTLIKRVA